MPTDHSEGDAGWVLATFLLLVPSILWVAWVSLRLWQWFLVPLFPALPTPSLGAMVGLTLATRYIINGSAGYKYDPRPPRERMFYSLGEGTLGPLLILGMGAIIHAVVY